MIGCPEILPFETMPLSARRHATLLNAFAVATFMPVVCDASPRVLEQFS
jgi:hypothetical protein